MADIRAFRGFRYDLGHVGALSDVVAPPYDVIDAELQQSLYERNPHNVIRLELNREQPGDSDTANRYTRAAAFLREWINTGALVQDSARSLYAYHQVFKVDGKEHTRKGFLARVRLEPFGQGCIFPHEETMAGPKADRLRLLQATGMNLSPIFGLYPDPLNEVQSHLDRAVGRSLSLEAVDHLGVVSRLWPIADQRVVSQVTGLLGPKPLFIADGHHRYETGLRYLDERRHAGEIINEDSPAQFILMMLVSMSDPGLLILPTHRLISGLPGLTADDLHALLEPEFEVQALGCGSAAMQETWEWIEADGGQNVLGFVTRADGQWLTARLKSPEKMAALVAAHSPEWRSLGVSILHVLVIDQLLSSKGKPACRYVHSLNEVEEDLASQSCDVAALVPPARMEHVEQIAGHLEKMPPKSTYFYPKLLSGLVFNSVRK